MLNLQCNYIKAMDDLNLEHYKFQTEHYDSLLQSNKEMKLLQAKQEATTLQIARQRSLLAQQFAASAQLAAAVTQGQSHITPFMLPKRPSKQSVSQFNENRSSLNCNDQCIYPDTSVAHSLLSL